MTGSSHLHQPAVAHGCKGGTYVVHNLLLQLQLIACELVPELCLPVCQLLRHVLQVAAQGGILSLQAAHKQDTCDNGLHIDKV